jgi:XTP/dITP diphosphohydrolase
VERLKARFCSQNPHKLDEMRAALPGWELELLDADDYPPESGDTYYENAAGKARYGRALAPADAWTIGDDSGIELAALGGAPGVRSARWADDWVARTLEALADADDRRARYVCELVAISPAGDESRGTGILEGEIAREPRGDEGFGYDPIFVPLGESRTVAELGDAWKREHSHRARAARALHSAIRT